MCFRPAAVDLNGPIKCPKCGAAVLSHRVCKACGSYGGEQILEVKSAD